MLCSGQNNNIVAGVSLCSVISDASEGPPRKRLRCKQPPPPHNDDSRSSELIVGVVAEAATLADDARYYHTGSQSSSKPPPRFRITHKQSPSRSRLDELQRLPVEKIPEIELMDDFEQMEFVSNYWTKSKKGTRQRKLAVWPPVSSMWLAVDYDYNDSCTWLNCPVRLTCQEAEIDAKRQVHSEREDRRFHLEEEQSDSELSHDDSEDSRAVLVAPLSPQGLNKLTAAQGFDKLMKSVQDLQRETAKRLHIARLTLKRLPVSMVTEDILLYAFPEGF